jgi:chemotaxis signal transduction protein
VGDSRQKAAPRSWTLLVFSVGGRRLAAKADEVAGIAKWKASIPVPSRTPFVSAVVRDDQTVLPVFDLAGLLHLAVRGDELLCLTAKHPQGLIAMCIDGEMPVLHTVELAALEPCQGETFDSHGSFVSGVDKVPIIALTKLGLVERA